MTTREQRAKERLANIVVRMTLEGDTEAASAALETLATFDNVQRLPGSDGQPGFGRGWGYGDPYDEAGYGRAAPARRVPNTGDLPTSFDEDVEEDEDPDKIADVLEAEDKKKDKKKEDKEEDVEHDPEDAEFHAKDFDLDVTFASVVQKVATALGEDAATEFSGLFGIFGAQSGVAKVAESDDDDDDDDDDEVEVVQEKKPRNKREVIQVWRDDLIPDISPIIKRVLKHVSVQYSLPYSTLIEALRGQDSQVADLLADSLER